MIYGKAFVKDFTNRTLKNLKVIDGVKANQIDDPKNGRFEVFEDTHFVNSCLGLLVFPRKGCLVNIPTTLELTSDGWPSYFADAGFQAPPNIRQLIRHLRNGISHCNLKFSSDVNYNIKSVCIWDECTNCKVKNWQVTWSISDFRKFVMKFSDILINNDYCSQCPQFSECSKQTQ
jgi:hypothetical protein